MALAVRDKRRSSSILKLPEGFDPRPAVSTSAPDSRLPAAERLVSGKGADAGVHDSWIEYFHVGIHMFIAAAFAIGSYCFFSWAPGGELKTYIGDWLFIVASCLGVFLTSSGIIENIYHEKDHSGTSSPSLSDSDAPSGSGESEIFASASGPSRQHSPHEEDLERHELAEGLHYFVAYVLFAVGSLLFMPNLFSGEAEHVAHKWGAWLFIAGSFAFVMASFHNSLAMAASTGMRVEKGEMVTETEAKCLRMAGVELWLGLLGSVLFVVGSFDYRPGYDTHCPDVRAYKEIKNSESLIAEAMHSNVATSFIQVGKALVHHHASHRRNDPLDAARKEEHVMCASVMDEGTLMYVIGSLMFLIQGFLHLGRIILMERQDAEDLRIKKSGEPDKRKSVMVGNRMSIMPGF